MTSYKAAYNVKGLDHGCIIVHDDGDTNYLYIGAVLHNKRKILCRTEGTRISRENFDRGTLLYTFEAEDNESAIDSVLWYIELNNLWDTLFKKGEE